MTHTARYRVPPHGPTDPAVYLHLLAVHDSDRGVIGPDGDVWACNTMTKTRVELDLTHVDDLLRLGWLESPDHETLTITEQGRYWLAKFLKRNGGAL